MTPWREYKPPKSYPKLDKSVAADVAIIGGGITGVLSAYRLAKSGKKVALIEKKKLGSYATMDTTAFITKVIDSDLTETASLFGEKAAKDVWASGQAAVDEFERLIEEEGISCEFSRCSNYVFATSDKQMKGLREEHEAYERFGIEARLDESIDTLGFKHRAYIEVPGQAKFHVTKFIYALADKAEAAGAMIFEDSCATGIEAKDQGVAVRTKDGRIEAADVVIATYKPITNKRTHLKKGMYRSYVFEVSVPKGEFAEALYEDSSNPYHYFRIDPQDGGHDRMIIGGEDHKDMFGKALVSKSYEGLERYLDKLMDGRDYKITRKWNGPILEPSDGLPLIGEIKPHHYVATAFSGNGMTYSMIASMIFADSLSGKKNAWSEVYDPKRTLLHPKRLAVKAKDYTEEFFGGAMKNLLS